MYPYRKPATTTVAFFGKKEPAKPAPKKAKVKGLYGPTGGANANNTKPKPKPKPVAKKPMAPKKTTGAAPKPLFSFGSMPAAKQTPVAKKSLFSFGSTSTTKKSTTAKQAATTSKYTIKKSTGTTIKKKPIVRTMPIATVKVAAPPAPKSTAAAPATPRAPVQYDAEQVGTLGVASIFAGTFLLTLAVLPTAVETALEVVGVGYTAYFTYNYITNSSARDDFGSKLDEIEDSTGLNLRQVAQVTGELAEKTSKKLAEQAEKAAEERVAAAAAAKKEAEKMADEALESAAKIEVKVEEALEEK